MTPHRAAVSAFSKGDPPPLPSTHRRGGTASHWTSPTTLVRPQQAKEWTRIARARSDGTLAPPRLLQRPTGQWNRQLPRPAAAAALTAIPPCRITLWTGSVPVFLNPQIPMEFR